MGAGSRFDVTFDFIFVLFFFFSLMISRRPLSVMTVNEVAFKIVTTRQDEQHLFSHDSFPVRQVDVDFFFF